MISANFFFLKAIVIGCECPKTKLLCGRYEVRTVNTDCSHAAPCPVLSTFFVIQTQLVKISGNLVCLMGGAKDGHEQPSRVNQ